MDQLHLSHQPDSLSPVSVRMHPFKPRVVGFMQHLPNEGNEGEKWEASIKSGTPEPRATCSFYEEGVMIDECIKKDIFRIFGGRRLKEKPLPLVSFLTPPLTLLIIVSVFLSVPPDKLVSSSAYLSTRDSKGCTIARHFVMSAGADIADNLSVIACQMVGVL